MAGFFGSMQPANATSFMSPPPELSGMGGGDVGDSSGSPINQAILAMLMKAISGDQGQQQGQPQNPMAPPGMTPAQTPDGKPSPQALAGLNPMQPPTGGAPGGAPGMPPGGAGGIAQILSKLDPNMLKQLLQQRGIGGPIAPAGGMPGQ